MKQGKRSLVVSTDYIGKSVRQERDIGQGNGRHLGIPWNGEYPSRGLEIVDFADLPLTHCWPQSDGSSREG